MTGMCLCGCVPVLFFADVMRMHRHVNAFLGKEKEKELGGIPVL